MKIINYLILVGCCLIGIVGFGQQKNILVSSEVKQSPLANRYAFIVGNDHYKDNSIARLASCRLDAVRFSSYLKSHTSWSLPKENISLLLDANNEIFKNEFKKLIDQIDHPDISTLYFYYSGHGVKGNIVPSDFKKGNAESLIPYEWILEEIGKIGINASVFVIDACYSGSIIDMKETSNYDENYLKAFHNSKNSNTVIFTATNAYRVTAAGAHSSMYSKHFMKAIENKDGDLNNDGILTSKELFEDIKFRMGEMNVPQFSGNQNFPMANFQESEYLRNQLLGNQISIPSKVNSRITASASNGKSSMKGLAIINWRTKMESSRRDRVAIEKVIQKLIEEGTPLGRSKVGFLYARGIGVENDFNKAISYFVSAAAEGDSFAEYNLGYLLATGSGLTKDMARAIRYYKKAADKGDPFAQNNLGWAYIKTENGTPKYNFALATDWISKAAESGLTTSQFALGNLYKKQAKWVTISTLKDEYLKKAFEWLKKAAMNGHPKAQYELAHIYEFGLGKDKDVTKSKTWYKKACSNQEMLSCKKLMILANLD